MAEDNSWKTSNFRQSVVNKMYVRCGLRGRPRGLVSVGFSRERFFLSPSSPFHCSNEAIQQTGMTSSKNGIEMENHVFHKARNKDEYLGFVARLILHVREMSKCHFLGD